LFINTRSMESLVATKNNNYNRKMIQKAVTFHGQSPDSSQQHPKRKRRKSKLRKDGNGKIKRNSVLKPSVYQKIQKKRRSQIIDNKGSKNNALLSLRGTRSTVVDDNISRLRVKVDYRRTVFVSLRGFYECWRLIPPHILFDAILILPLYREWIISPLKYKHEFNDILSDSKFVTLLQWKDKQGLIFFMLNAINAKVIVEYKIKNQNNTDKNLIAPFWYYLSDKLQSLYDPDTCDSYRPLLLNERWWKYAYSNKGNKTCSLYYSHYNVSSEDVLNELWFLTMKFKTISEILYQSNPSLNVVITYNDLNNKSLLHLKSSYSSPLNKQQIIPNNNQSQLSTPSSVYNSPLTQYTFSSNSINSPITPPSLIHDNNNNNNNNHLPQQILAIKSILSEELKLDDNNNHNNYLSPKPSSKPSSKRSSRLCQLDQCDEEEDIEVEATPDTKSPSTRNGMDGVAVSIDINATDLENMDNNYLSTCDTFIGIQSSPSILNTKYNMDDCGSSSSQSSEDDMESSSNMISKIMENSKICHNLSVMNSGSDTDYVDNDDEIKRHLLNYKDKGSSSEESACSSAMFATINNKTPSKILSNDSNDSNDDDSDYKDDDEFMSYLVDKQKEKEQEQELEREEAEIANDKQNDKQNDNDNDYQDEQSTTSTSTSYDGQESRKQTLDDMEWWVCPDYYYDTYKNKIDTDCDTDY